MNTENIEKLHEDVLAKHKMHPFWVMADPEGFNPDTFWCFIGAHYPDGLVSVDPDKYNEALDDLNCGHWALMARKANPGKKVGYGWAKTPSLAFIGACKMAGYMQAGA